MQENGRRDINKVGRELGQGGAEIRPRRNTIRFSFGRRASHDARQPAARLRENGGKNAFGGDIADAGQEPSEHRLMLSFAKRPE